jgi:hypothetical protein
MGIGGTGRDGTRSAFMSSRFGVRGVARFWQRGVGGIGVYCIRGVDQGFISTGSAKKRAPQV